MRTRPRQIKSHEVPARDALADRALPVVKLTGLRTPCALIDRFRNGLKRAMGMKHEHPDQGGVLGVVKTSRQIEPRDFVNDIAPFDRLRPLPTL